LTQPEDAYHRGRGAGDTWDDFGSFETNSISDDYGDYLKIPPAAGSACGLVRRLGRCGAFGSDSTSGASFGGDSFWGFCYRASSSSVSTEFGLEEKSDEIYIVHRSDRFSPQLAVSEVFANFSGGDAIVSRVDRSTVQSEASIGGESFSGGDAIVRRATGLPLKPISKGATVIPTIMKTIVKHDMQRIQTILISKIARRRNKRSFLQTTKNSPISKCTLTLREATTLKIIPTIIPVLMLSTILILPRLLPTTAICQTISGE
jgi:hypothetical protein